MLLYAKKQTLMRSAASSAVKHLRVKRRCAIPFADALKASLVQRKVDRAQPATEGLRQPADFALGGNSPVKSV